MIFNLIAILGHQYCSRNLYQYSDTDSVQLMDIYSAGEANTSGISSYDFVDSLLKRILMLNMQKIKSNKKE